MKNVTKNAFHSNFFKIGSKPYGSLVIAIDTKNDLVLVSFLL